MSVDQRLIKEFIVSLDGLDDSVRALEIAASFAARLDIPVSAAIVSSPRLDAISDVEWMDRVCERLDVELAQSVVISDNDVVDALLRFTGERDGALLCMASHARGPLGQWMLGSVSSAVLRKSPRPVMLVGPHCRSVDRFDAVDVCLDGSNAARGAIDPGVEWARALGATPWLVHVEEPGTPATYGDTTVGAVVQGPAQHLQTSGITVEWEVLHGDDPAVTIVEHAAHIGAALIVATTHGRTGVSALALGSVATGIVRHAPCPVLAFGPRALEAMSPPDRSCHDAAPHRHPAGTRGSV
jgi:nucleotide-binding universal stress UspA family protein